MAKAKNVYVCQSCGYEVPKWAGKCPSCNEWNTFVEELVQTGKGSLKTSLKPQSVTRLSDIDIDDTNRVSTGISELDRVLSGGFVEGSLTLIGGDPGIGKSTLLLQICETLGSVNKKILYVSGEESIKQIKLRALRLNITTENLYLLAETNMSVIEETAKHISPDFLIVDSIQTVFKDELSSAPGSVSQVRECTLSLMHLGKGKNISVIVVGHVTKDGAMAGPKVLEHIVDTVLYFEGERKASYRILRSVKNRFGNTNEIGVFDMQESGLKEIKNPSEYMLSGRPLNVSGSAVTASIEGTRPVLCEIQALTSYTNFGMPRRTAIGLDYNRMALLIAVLEKRLGFKMSNYDVYLNLAGGMKILEPSLDAPMVAAIASSYKNKAVDPYTMVFGEVGLTGELRAVNQAEKRINEAYKMGFKTCVVPKDNYKAFKDVNSDDMKIYGVSNIEEMLNILVY